MKKFLFLLFVCFGVFVPLQNADALRITLKRVIFEGPKRAEVITIINNKDEPKTYRLGWRYFQMTEENGLVHVENKEDLPASVRPADDMVRYAPRRFTVPPRSSQQVRMMLRLPADLEDGEYRSHLWVRPEADVDELKKTVEEDRAKKEIKSGVSMVLLAGVTMPVIVRKGNLSATASITDFTARGTSGFIDVSMNMNRSGTRSIYGDLTFICNPGLSEYVIHESKGNAVYTEVERRKIDIKIARKPESPECGSILVKFLESDNTLDEKKALSAEAQAVVQ